MKALFVAVDAGLAQSGGDHTLRLTKAHLEGADIPAEPVVEWLLEHGGCCDYEVLWNAEPAWRDSIA
jgi:hypothetical protein